jgi:hypothetical protein
MANWFGPKLFGYGYRPISAKGWMVTALFVLLLVVWKLGGHPSFGLPTFVVPAALIGALWLTAYLTSRSATSNQRE